MINKCINAVRALSVDQIERAKSGHPGMPLGCAPTAFTLWARHMSHNPKNPAFFNRDRFILSAGHASSMVYALLHLFGYDMSKEDLMSFRQLNSRTPGHPEREKTAGIEVSTGPLGQGVANGVGFAMAEAMLASRFNQPDLPLVDHYTFVLASDGDMMEGIETEAAGLAGVWGLKKLIIIYDSNNICIEGKLNGVFEDDVAKRHEALGFNVLRVLDGNDVEQISSAITLAKASDKPSLIIVNTTIGYGSPLANTNKCHGAPLGEENARALKQSLGIKEKPFEVAKDVSQYMESLSNQLSASEDAHKKIVREYKKKYPELYEEFLRFTQKPPQIDVSDLDLNLSDMATRDASGQILNKICDIMPNLVGGSADLASSVKSVMNGKGTFSRNEYEGRNISFGVKEHAMGAIINGIYLHGGFNVYASTFFVFSDYMKPAIRMSAMMGIPALFLFSHDSIGVGEDGPTHQPIEQLTGLRAIPNLRVFRPADVRETAAAYLGAFNKQPTALILTRQVLPLCQNTDVEQAKKGGYIVYGESEKPDCILIASGSELKLAIESAEVLAISGVDARVVSMPCMELFDSQPQKYKDTILPPDVRARITIEAGSSYSWHKLAGLDGATISIDTFGVSAPATKLFEIYGFTVENVVAVAQKTIKRVKKISVN